MYEGKCAHSNQGEIIFSENISNISLVASVIAEALRTLATIIRQEDGGGVRNRSFWGG